MPYIVFHLFTSLWSLSLSMFFGFGYLSLSLTISKCLYDERCYFFICSVLFLFLDNQDFKIHSGMWLNTWWAEENPRWIWGYYRLIPCQFIKHEYFKPIKGTFKALIQTYKTKKENFKQYNKPKILKLQIKPMDPIEFYNCNQTQRRKIWEIKILTH